MEAKGCPLFELSAATHQGAKELMYAAARELSSLPPVIVYEPTYVERPPEVDTSESLDIQRDEERCLAGGRALAAPAYGQCELWGLRISELV